MATVYLMCMGTAMSSHQAKKVEKECSYFYTHLQDGDLNLLVAQ